MVDPVIERIVMSDDFTIVSFKYPRNISEWLYSLAVLPLPIIFHSLSLLFRGCE